MQMGSAMAHGAFMQGPMCPPMQPFNPDAGTPEDVLKKRTWHPISTSISCVLKVPKSQQIDGIVSIAPSLDSTLTGQCESDVLAVLVFMLTGIKANFPLSQLRVTYYEELWEKYAVAAKRTEEWYWSSESGSLFIQIEHMISIYTYIHAWELVYKSRYMMYIYIYVSTKYAIPTYLFAWT